MSYEEEDTCHMRRRIHASLQGPQLVGVRKLGVDNGSYETSQVGADLHV